MGARTLKLSTRTVYEEDFAAWATETARLLRERRFDEIDMEHLAEEVEAMAGRDRREVASRLRVLLAHLLKWTHQPRKRSRSWQSSIDTQRAELEQIFQQSPSLKRGLGAVVNQAYRQAVRNASIETALKRHAFPAQCPFSLGEILDPDFLPE